MLDITSVFSELEPDVEVDGQGEIHDTEDKAWWVVYGLKTEAAFVKVCRHLGLPCTINPEKQSNVYAPDLLFENRLADLKFQKTPFFLAERLYKIPCQYAITFNCKDFLRYEEKYPELDIIFWVNWMAETRTFPGHRETSVRTMFAIAKAPFAEIQKGVHWRIISRHEYKRRQDDKQGNARDSYVLDLRTLNVLYLNACKEIPLSQLTKTL